MTSSLSGGTMLFSSPPRYRLKACKLIWSERDTGRTESSCALIRKKARFFLTAGLIGLNKHPSAHVPGLKGQGQEEVTCSPSKLDISAEGSCVLDRHQQTKRAAASLVRTLSAGQWLILQILAEQQRCLQKSQPHLFQSFIQR